MLASIGNSGAQNANTARPLTLRRQSSDLQQYIDMYGLGKDDGSLSSRSRRTPDTFKGVEDQSDLFLSQDVAQELRNLQNLRRLSLDVSSFDPDVPPQNYDLSAALQTQHSAEDDSDDTALTNSLYWVPARIHPELAPQEWQSFVQKRDAKLDGEAYSTPFKTPPKRGLSRSKSLLSREISERSADVYTDAGPILEKRRSTLRPAIRVADLENLQDNTAIPNEAFSGLGIAAIEEQPDLENDAPLVIPPPGSILRRAARTGKGRGGSYRRLGKSAVSSETPRETQKTMGFAPVPSERFELVDHPEKSKDAVPPLQKTLSDEVDEVQVGRKKSRNRTAQVLGKDETGVHVTRSPDATQLSFVHDWSVPEELPKRSALPNSETSTLSIHDTPGSVKKASLNEPNPSTNIVTPHSSSPTKDNPSAPRPGLKRELSAASLTRAVMSGTAAPINKPQPIRSVSETPTSTTNTAPDLPQSTKKSAWGKLFSSEEKVKTRKDVKTPAKLKRSTSNEDRANHDKDGSTNLFSNIFGKKKDKDAIEPTKRIPTPERRRTGSQVEPQYYTRFPVQLERAIYRMAHLKLGNSRRPLVHQVLLSNFMYGYLALIGASTSPQGTSHHQRSRSQPANRLQANNTEEEFSRQQQRPSSANNEAQYASSRGQTRHNRQQYGTPSYEGNSEYNEKHWPGQSRPVPPVRSSSIDTS